ncbi:MAG: hypothetical protein WCO06_01335 [Candidatus Roizmanbacteria bacterium]
MVNIKDFLTKKELGLSRILEVTSDNIVVAYKSFNMEKAKLGEVVELPEEVSVQSKEELVKANAVLQAQIDENTSFLNSVVA